MRSMKLFLGGMMLILGFLFGGCSLSKVKVSLVVGGSGSEEEAIVGGKNEVRDCCDLRLKMVVV